MKSSFCTLFFLTFIVFVPKAQDKSLSEIQKEVLSLKSNFTSHYDMLKLKSTIRLDELMREIGNAQSEKSRKLDSLNKLRAVYLNEFEKDKAKAKTELETAVKMKQVRYFE